LNAKERDALMQRQAHPWLTDGAEIIQRLIATNRKLEQEAVDAERVIKLLEFDLVKRGEPCHSLALPNP